jgi:signal transduction histidine kinase
LKDRALELTITPVKNQQREKWGATVVFHDITSEKSLEKLRQEFTAMMVHELRAPLTAVHWSSDAMLKNLNVLESQSQTQKLKESVATIQSATVNMLELVNDLLDVAKLESGKFDLNVQEYDLANIIREQVQTYKAQACFWML